MKASFFVMRKLLAWGGVCILLLVLWGAILEGRKGGALLGVAIPVILVVVTFRSISHVHRVRLISGSLESDTLGSRHRRRIELPFPAGEAFEIVETAVRELPHVDSLEASSGSLQLHARVKRMNPYLSSRKGRREALGPAGARRNLVLATVTPGDGTSSLLLLCEPEGGAWVDWFMVDDGTNLENIEAISRAIQRRVAEKRKDEAGQARETATEKELTVARLNLLHAQVEPHFLYNTLASAQILARTDPAKADQMLGHLIVYLRRSVPRAEDAVSTLGEELERAHAYLEILRIRMGDRLGVQVQVPEALRALPMPAMMLQTLVENAIKHGLEPVAGGGTVWIIARETGGKVAVTVADDGRGFSDQGGGTGIGLKNIRERLRLAYGDAASFSIVANFPRGVAATITLPPHA
jgi:signal transduction histidine kinase